MAPQIKNPPCGGSFILKALFWRRPTLPLRVPSAQEGLTAVFGMRTGVTLPPNHQNRAFKFSYDTNECKKKECMLRYATPTISFQEFCRGISTPRLNTLLRFHLVPINLVISHDPITIPYLRVGFPLRCFQRLSVPDIATGRCHWCDSPQTRGQFISVLSY